MGFDLAKEADEFLNGGQYKKAIPLYDEAISIGRKPALALHQQQQQQQQEEDGDDGATTQQTSTEELKWIIRLYCNSANAHLQTNDLNGARRSAWAACVYSQNSDLTSMTLFADVCHASGDVMNQVQAVKRILELEPVDEEGLSNDEVVKRRKMSLRLTRLEQDLHDAAFLGGNSSTSGG